MRIPQSDPKAAYLAHQDIIDVAVKRVLASGWYILGNEVKAFEREFADAMEFEHAVGVANGTDAIELALRACGVGAGDWVATVSHTAVATVAAIRRVGAYPLFVDIEPVHYTMSPESLMELLRVIRPTSPKAVIPVHLYGHPADISAIVEIAHDNGMKVIEDCAQAHGAKLDGKFVGGLGDFGCYSFYPTKNLGALGDGGAIVTNDVQAMEKVRLLREYGWKERYISSIEGINSRLDELQAAILRAKLPYLFCSNDRRRTIAGRYQAGLCNTGLVLPTVADNVLHVYHQYVIEHERRDELRAALQSRGIGTGIHYPRPVHRQPAYTDPDYAPISLACTDAAAAKILSLPMYPELPDHAVDAVIATLDDALEQGL